MLLMPTCPPFMLCQANKSFYLIACSRFPPQSTILLTAISVQRSSH
uniref:Uncharacterized protein n=1 Tax=Rhizophora mucronata TaxID=61149 RepID=A0A2P2QC86_RHIMU